MLSRKLRSLITIFLMVTSIFCLINVSQAYGDGKESSSRVLQTWYSIEASYLSLLQAERAGGDVSELVAHLNFALELYSEGEIALESGEYEAVVLITDKANEISSEVL